MLVHEIPEGGYAQIGNQWYLRPPKTRRACLASADKFQFTIHEDGTLTVRPSLNYGPEFHGWLTRGMWTTVEPVVGVRC